MLKNISSIIFAVITLVWKKPLYRAIYIAYSLKFGETLAAKAVGNPELSLEWPGKCTDLTGEIPRLDQEKVGAVMKITDYSGISSNLSYCNNISRGGYWNYQHQYELPSSSFHSKSYPPRGGNRWNFCGWVDRIRGSKKRNGQLSLFRIDIKGAVNA